MALFSILCFDKGDSLELRRQLHKSYQHVIQQLADAGKLLYAGDMLKSSNHENISEGFHASIAIANFNDIEEAKAWIVQHPYTTADVFANIEICPYQDALGETG